MATIVEEAAPSPALTRREIRSARNLRRWYRNLWWAGCALFALQAAGLVAWSRQLFDRFDLTNDFASFAQAWSQIGSGHLNPYSTSFPHGYPHWGFPFWQSHLEVAMWPLALLHLVSHSAFSLLVVQDLAVAGANLLALRLGLDLLERHWKGAQGGGVVIGAGLAALLAVDPWSYWTASFDFHFQPIALFFALLTVRDLWRGSSLVWLWAACVLACGDVAASYLVGAGIAAALAGRETRRRGLLLGGAGFLWICTAALIGSGKGSNLVADYAYLAPQVHAAGTGVGATLSLWWGILRHPSHAFHTLSHRWPKIEKYAGATGTVGIASALGVGLWLMVILPNALNVSPLFVVGTAAFQSFAAVVAGCAGLAMVVTWLSARGRWGVALAYLAATFSLVQAGYVADQWTGRIGGTIARVDGPTATSVSQALNQIPADAEVIASNGVIGRFGARRSIYPFYDLFSDGVTIPVNAGLVAVVIVPRQGIETATPAQSDAAIAAMRSLPGARAIVDTDSVTVFLWQPPPGTRSITFPAVGVPPAPAGLRLGE